MTLDGKICVLLVDDDPNVQTVCTIYLRQLGFDVEGARNGIQALAALNGDGLLSSGGLGSGLGCRAAYDADVILLDLLMPVMTGYDFLEQYDGPVPVVVMSGLSDVSKLPRQPFALVVKPMSMFEVADTLREAAASWRAKGETP